MQRRIFLQGLIALAVAMRVPLQPTQAVPTGDGHSWLEYGIKDGVAYEAMGVGDTVHVLYVTADGYSNSKLLVGDVEWRTHLLERS